MKIPNFALNLKKIQIKTRRKYELYSPWALALLLQTSKSTKKKLIFLLESVALIQDLDTTQFQNRGAFLVKELSFLVFSLLGVSNK